MELFRRTRKSGTAWGRTREGHHFQASGGAAAVGPALLAGPAGSSLTGKVRRLRSSVASLVTRSPAAARALPLASKLSRKRIGAESGRRRLPSRWADAPGRGGPPKLRR